MNRLSAAALIAASILIGCTSENVPKNDVTETQRFQPRIPADLQESAARARTEKLAFLQESPARIWSVALYSIAVCPSAADWYPGAEAIQRLEFESIPDLPDHCWRLKQGDIIKLPPPGKRRIEIHADHVIMQAHTAAGREFWTDELGEIAITPAS